VILGAVYMLWMFQRVFTGVPEGDNATMTDATGREMLIVVPLLALSLFLGLYSKPVIDRVEPTVKCVMRTFERETSLSRPKPDQIKRGDDEVRGCR
jgi:NADH-quinone oxidoreductase subunit M